ncbi:MAG: hypothetical protein WD023_07860 [Ilumatobacteraceae bacterium]
MKNRLQALSLLDRALLAMTDEELETLVATVPDDHRGAIDTLCGAREGGFEDPAARTLAVRSAAARGRMSGVLEQLATVLTDPCLADCITALGESSDNPSEDQIQAVVPGLVETHGVATVRLTFAASIAGEAAASVTLTRLLKSDEVLALPAAVAPVTPVVLVNEADADTKAKRKAAKERKQAESRARREQQAKARNRA